MLESIRTLWPYMRRYRWGLVRGMGSLVIKDVAGAAVPLLIGGAIDALTAGNTFGVVFRFALLLVGVSLIKGLFQYWMRVILIGISRDVEFDLRNDLFSHLITLSSDFYAKYRTGDIMARSTNDLNAVRMMLGPGIMYWTETMLTAVLSIAVMVSVNWQLTLICLVPAPLVSLVVIIF